MTEMDKYLFDLQGYLVVENVLNSEEMSEMNDIIDEQNPQLNPETNKLHRGGFLTWGLPFVNLIDHERIMLLLEFILGDGFRLDHYYAIYMNPGGRPGRLHGGNTPYDPPEYYHFRGDRMYNGLTVVAWNLTDTGPDYGGFCCIPGSHKANYRCPSEIKDAHQESEVVVIPKVKAGALVIFTEALTHGTAPWTAEHRRRSLLFKYSPAQQSWSKTHIKPPEGLQLTTRQQLLFEPPYFSQRTSLFSDG